MTTYETQQVSAWVGRQAVDVEGDKIGRVEAIYEDDDGSGPEWLAISTGLFGGSVSFAPISGATAEGDQLRLRWTKDVVKDAPRAEADGHLSPEEEQRLYQYYGMEWSGQDATPAPAPAARAERTGNDEAMTRSEEELDVGTRTREAGRARLRKWVETEQVQVTVPVRREVARLVTEPVTDANIGKAMSGPDITESEHDIVLNQEEVVVDKKVVPKERVRLEKDVIEEERQVVDEVRKERIQMDDTKGTRR